MSEEQQRGVAPHAEAPAETRARARMVEAQIAGRGVRDPRVLRAMGEVPRHCFVPGAYHHLAYDDRPLPIAFEQTISQPYMVARATELAAPGAGDRALEIGAGSGYQTAVLSLLCAEVFAVEVIPELAAAARVLLRDLGCDNVTLEAFDGSAGWPAHAPYDVIIVSAAAPRIPALLVDQLAEGGRLVLPVGGSNEDQILTCVRRRGSGYETTEDTRCRYVDLVGRYGVGSRPPEA